MIKNFNRIIEKFKSDEELRRNVKKYSVFCLLLLSLIIFYNYVDFNKYSLLSQVSNPYNPNASFSKVFTDMDRLRLTDVDPEVNELIIFIN